MVLLRVESMNSFCRYMSMSPSQCYFPQVIISNTYPIDCTTDGWFSFWMGTFIATVQKRFRPPALHRPGAIMKRSCEEGRK